MSQFVSYVDHAAVVCDVHVDSVGVGLGVRVGKQGEV